MGMSAQPRRHPQDQPPNLGETPFLGNRGLALMFLFSVWIYVGRVRGLLGEAVPLTACLEQHGLGSCCRGREDGKPTLLISWGLHGHVGPFNTRPRGSEFLGCPEGAGCLWDRSPSVHFEKYYLFSDS